MGARLQQIQKRGWLKLTGACMALPFLGGCASTIDTMTSQHFKEAPFHCMFGKDEDPLQVLRVSKDANMRAKAMLDLKEPARHGRPAAEQDEAIKILAASATTDQREYCRLNAIEALSRFEDPRTAQILLTAYYGANQNGQSGGTGSGTSVVQTSRFSQSALSAASTFTPEKIIAIQCRALESLGKKRSPEGLSLLCEVATMPARKDAKASDVETMLQGGLGQDQFDLRLAALRGLENYKGDATAAQVLYKVMTTENDVAVKDRAYLSLMSVTGKDFEPKSPEWAAIVKINPLTPVPGPVRPQPVVVSPQRVNQPGPVLTNLQPTIQPAQPIVQPAPGQMTMSQQPPTWSAQPPGSVTTNQQQAPIAGQPVNRQAPQPYPGQNQQPISPYNQQLILPPN